jgi:hypothetical protein
MKKPASFAGKLDVLSGVGAGKNMSLGRKTIGKEILLSPIKKRLADVNAGYG